RFLQALKSKSTLEFKQSVRTGSVLILDDLHLLKSTSTSTREELAHALSYYLDRGKQIAIASEPPPSELRLEPRLESRILAGLQLAVDPPDHATKKNLAHQIASSHEIQMSDELLDRVAGLVRGGVREIE